MNTTERILPFIEIAQVGKQLKVCETRVRQLLAQGKLDAVYSLSKRRYVEGASFERLKKQRQQ